MNIAKFKEAVSRLPDDVLSFGCVPPIVSLGFGARFVFEWDEGDDVHTFDIMFPRTFDEGGIRVSHSKRVFITNTFEMKQHTEEK